MSATHIVARIKAEPKSLYWRLRLLRAVVREPDGEVLKTTAPRKLIMESLFMLRRADPDAPVSASAIRDWSLPEARRWVRLIKRQAPQQTWLERAWELRDMAGRARRATLLKEARAALEHVSRSEWPKEHAISIAALLFETDLKTFEQMVGALLAGKERYDLPQRLVWWLISGKLSAPAAQTVRELLSRVPQNEIGPDARLQVLEFDGLALLKRRDLEGVARMLSEMTALVPGNCERLVTTLCKRGLLSVEVRAQVDAVLRKNWRSWVRPRFEKLQSKLETAATLPAR
jgi:hypothetical protein